MNESSVEVAESPTHSALTHPLLQRRAWEGGVLAEKEGQAQSCSALPQEKEEEGGISQESSEEEQ